MYINKSIFVNIDGDYEEAFVEGRSLLRSCDASLAVGDLVTESTTITNGVDKLSTNSNSRVVGIVVEKPTTTTAVIVNDGKLTGFSSLTKASKLYLSNNGTITTVKPEINYIHILGAALDPDTILFKPTNAPIKLAANLTPTPAATTKLLIHSDSYDGDTNIVDSSGNYTFNNSGLAHSTSFSKFGSTSIKMDGLHALTISTFSSIGTQDLTYDFWFFRLGVWPAYGGILGASTGTYFPLVRNDTNTFFYGLGTNSSTGNAYYSFTPNESEWYHVAVTREAGVVRVFLNGVLKTTTNWTTNLNHTDLVIGRRYNDIDDYYADNVYVDEFRLVVGEALWTANFTPPTQPYALA